METIIDDHLDGDINYSQEHHQVHTEDGYILTLVRIKKVEDVNKTTQTEDISEIQGDIESRMRPAALIVHGFLCSSDLWLINSPDKVLPYKLIEDGYDCWIANCRGTSLSKNHVSLQTNSKKFWDFSFHDIGVYDVPAMIDYILEKTNNESVYYIGHSMGCTVLTVCLSLRPEYNSKVKVMIALAPAVHLKYIRNKPFALGGYLGWLMSKVRCLRSREMMGTTIRDFVDKLSFSSPGNCNLNRSKKFAKWLINNVAVWCGAFGRTGLLDWQVQEIADKWPSPTSFKLYGHGMQIFISGEFKQYDYGRSKNLKLYGQADPPFYEMKNVLCPVATFYSEADELCPAQAVTRFAHELPNLIGNYGICQTLKFSHLCFMFRGDEVNSLVYTPVMGILKKIRDS